MTHEPIDELSQETREMHRALKSLIEELEAMDWYAQRVDATRDEELRGVLQHNLDEEKEHACMTLEWIRRHDPVMDTMLRKFLFSSGSIAEEAEEEDGNGAARHGDTALGIGSLRGGEPPA